MKRREGYGSFQNCNDDDNDWTFNNPSYGANAGSSILNRLKPGKRSQYNDVRDY